MSLMSGKEMRFSVPPKAFRLDGGTTQRIRQWVPNLRAGELKARVVPNVLRRNRGIFSLRRSQRETKLTRFECLSHWTGIYYSSSMVYRTRRGGFL